MRRSPAHPRSLAVPLALKPFLRDARNALRAIALRGDSLSVQPPPLLLPPPFPPLLSPFPPPGGVPRSSTTFQPALNLSSIARTATYRLSAMFSVIDWSAPGAAVAGYEAAPAKSAALDGACRTSPPRSG